MKLKNVYLPLFTALVIHNANGAENTDAQKGDALQNPNTKNRSALTSSAMTQLEEDLTESVSSQKHVPVTTLPQKPGSHTETTVSNLSGSQKRTKNRIRTRFESGSFGAGSPQKDATKQPSPLNSPKDGAEQTKGLDDI